MDVPFRCAHNLVDGRKEGVEAPAIHHCDKSDLRINRNVAVSECVWTGLNNPYGSVNFTVCEVEVADYTGHILRSIAQPE